MKDGCGRQVRHHAGSGPGTEVIRQTVSSGFRVRSSDSLRFAQDDNFKRGAVSEMLSAPRLDWFSKNETNNSAGWDDYFGLRTFLGKPFLIRAS